MVSVHQRSGRTSALQLDSWQLIILRRDVGSYCLCLLTREDGRIQTHHIYVGRQVQHAGRQEESSDSPEAGQV